ncbi:RNA polymerase sigma-70 factor, ECF subfamily [Amycolatopsis mediterranei S699]|uniref:RNA polymerase sigma-70 factor, ECF subfamily n=2 Tax=Amycolatopsis mediterranei TaxID=33910 RepID=A0A0H3CXZ7_AMYMU|nr:sigma-70 family RNA polymerase sigma factor [Amycolatopsis mediterranei]ADJ42784.1 RNA polymerase sigma-70 factor, ECF subfamily [Amycolatopsis mediterranei U32]AEK39475.1 RNA polymerase sigma-70 factor, ECF subfamily protein [Amycolatopsis mediterranei S699]AFO74497.1 RNA polymerase sigma-70 factor, ECF subfamily [Amycolatopsis mediterranei S699]AGT81626.1 RNA polymerase sigma-70 factor, ECF subfamily [Amycolatopsis mediterranei RB]KDO09916.1 RNA polymerase sigma 70 [Amycolatopsis mediterr
MDDLAADFEAERGRLRGLAYRMLGSAAEADDAVQEAWLRLNRAGSVDNLAAWLTTVVSRVCLDVLRSRKVRREEPFEVFPEPVDDADPADEAALADAVGRALLVVLDALGPAERIAFVLHDLFAVPFDRIAPVLDRTPVAAKKLASRARHRIRGTSPVPPADLARHRRVVDAFLAAARGGDLAALLDVLAPDVVRRADAAALPVGAVLETRGARAVAEETQVFGKRARFAETALIDGSVGVVVAPHGRLVLALAVTVDGERVAAYEVIADPARLAALHVTLLSA